MPAAYIDAANIRFPEVCIGCDAAPETTHILQARRGIDLLIVAHWEFTDLPVRVCRRCKKRRRAAGIVTNAGFILFIIVGGFVGLELALRDMQAAAATLIVVMFTLALVLRWRGDALVEWTTLGVAVDWLKGPGVPLRLTFRSDEYFSAWLRVNPRADFSESGARQMRDPKPDVSVDPLIHSRIIPAASLGVSLALLGLHYRYVGNQDAQYFVPVLILSGVGGLAAGGTVYPPIFYSIGVHGRHLPFYVKAIGALLAIAGFAAGCYLLFVVYAP